MAGPRMDIGKAARALEAVLEEIGAGEVGATDSQRAYITGALDALRGLSCDEQSKEIGPLG